MIWDLLELFNQHFTPLSFGEGEGGEALFSYFPRYDHLTLALSNVK